MFSQHIYRMRRTSGVADGTVFVAEADIFAYTEAMAIVAVYEGRVRNWRNVETLGETSQKTIKYQFLGEIQKHQAKKPAYPIGRKD